ncbi:Fanconi anemia group A protein isoform X2 [Haemorhous mexicanus]|uniref:Fanconi anemia group A protein isoform X2 n=1 Tax=Haemorhous mexicanus TaxID=30427 RepID=UPI0028BEB7B1|nr:Fanconi anemia group A protein isoform X2 [Haemorhous mexicanus]
MAGAGGRSWRDLLGRARKRRSPFGSAAELQGAALRLLDQHQNLAELLLEVGDSAKPGVQDGAEPRGVSPESFIVSVLQEQASKLGVPTATLAAKNAVANVERICQDSASPSQVPLLNSDQRKRLTCLLQTVKDLLANNMFCRSLFCQEMWKMKEPPVLEAVWHLHRGDIVGLAELLDRSPAGPAAVEWLCSSLCGLCEQAGDISCGDTELAQGILSDFAIVFLQHGFEQAVELGRKVEFQKVAYICRAVLQRMLAWVLDAVGKEKQEDVSMVQAARFWLNVFNVSLYGSVAPPDSLRQFFRHTLTEVLTYNPALKVSDAIQMQKEWSFTRTSPLLTALYRKLLVAFSVKESICQLQQVLESHEVNWQHVLSCVSTLVVCQAEAEQLFKDLLSHLLLKAFGNYDMENMITAFLIARQAALEGPAVFMPYSEWFKASFGSAGGYHGSSKKSLVFLLEFLSELVPFEAAPYLKVHIMFPPFVPSKHRSLLLEYITLAKTRLADLKVAIEDMGLYEDLSAPEEAVQPQAQALRDVEKALQIFENTRKIPTSVIEASIFRRPYYTSWFLPALLRPRVLPKAPDGRMAFIDSLKRADKIPSSLYSTYLQACHAMKEKVLQDDSKAEPSHAKEPFEQLKAELAVLRTLAVQQAQWEEVAAQLAVVSDRLRRVLGDSSEDSEAAPFSSPVRVAMPAPGLAACPQSVPAPGLAACPQSVVDLLLTSFCQTLLAASSFNPPDRQGPCLSLLVKMMCGHRNLLPALLGRLCQLIYHQGPSLGAAHILGLAAFVIHLSECRALIPGVEANSGASQAVPGKALSVSEYWSSLLLCRTEESFAFCLRFCTAAAAYLMCKFSSCSHEDFCALVPPGLIKKLQYLVPRLSLEARGVLCEEAKSALSWSSLSCPSLNYRRASLCLWRSALCSFLIGDQKLLVRAECLKFLERLGKLQKLRNCRAKACPSPWLPAVLPGKWWRGKQLEILAFLLSFREWLLMELEVCPEKDILSASERQDFHHWAIYQRYLPAPSAAGGCDGDLEKACAVILNAILDSSQSRGSAWCVPSFRLDLGACAQSRTSLSPEILCRLQELVLELRCRPKLLPGCSAAQRHFLFELLQGRLTGRDPEHGSALGEQLWRQQELLLHSRILLGLPASTLVTTCWKGNKAVLDCDSFFCFVNSELKNVSSRGYALSYGITAHFFRGLLNASLDCEDAAEGVNQALATCQTKCPVVLLSAALWWPRLEAALCSQWKRLFGAPLAEELARLRGWHSSASRFLCSGAALPVSDPPWLSAAFLHGAILQQSPRGRGTEALERLGTDAEQLLVALLFFSLLDLISARIAPKLCPLSVEPWLAWFGEEGTASLWCPIPLGNPGCQEGVDFQTSLEWSLQILQCLQGRGTSWPLLFHSAEGAPGRFRVLRSAASQRHTRLLPLAFYSLTPSFQQELLQQEPAFLSVALQMYIQLLQLFVEGEVLPQSDRDPTEHDPLELISAARQFLLGAIPHCPAQSLGNIQPLLSTCEELDPELAATLLHFSRPAVDMELEEELELF